MAQDDGSREMGVWERLLRSRALRGVVRIHVGFALVRSWAADVQAPPGKSVHLFDYLLYRRADTDQPFEEWVRTRELR